MKKDVLSYPSVFMFSVIFLALLFFLPHIGETACIPMGGRCNWNGNRVTSIVVDETGCVNCCGGPGSSCSGNCRREVVWNVTWNCASQRLTVTENAPPTASGPCYCIGYCFTPSTPYLMVEKQGAYYMDNEVLSTYFDQYYERAKQWYEDDAPHSFGLQSTDHYKMRLNPDVTAEGIKLLVREIEAEESHFDHIQLLRILHANDTDVIIDHQTQAILAVKKEIVGTPLSCDMQGTDCLAAISQVDQQHIAGKKGDILELKFDVSGLKGQEVYFMMNSWGGFTLKNQEYPFAVEGTRSFITFLFDVDNTGNYVTAKRIHPREFESDHYLRISDMINTLKGNTLGIRLEWTETHTLDYISMVQVTTEDYREEELGLSQAFHSVDGDVTAAMQEQDMTYAHTVRGDWIELLFDKPQLSIDVDEKESYVFVSSGFYHGLRTYLYPSIDPTESWKSEMADYAEQLRTFVEDNDLPVIIDVDFYKKRAQQ
jgi:hypothetical protein